MQVSEGLLPERFRDLDLFVADWALATELERNSKRLVSSIEEMETLYDALLPKMDAIIEYLNQFPLNRMPKEAEKLFFLTLSLAEIAPAVEYFGQPNIPGGFDSTRFVKAHKRLA